MKQAVSANRLTHAKTASIVAGLMCFGIVVVALVIQTSYQLEPCPLCITQRIIFMSLGVLFLIAAFIPQNSVFKKILSGLQLLTALGGAGVAIRHWYLQAHKDSIIADCGVGFNYMFDNFPLQKAFKLLFRGTGDCAAIDWTFLGLTLPQLALLSFLALAGCAIYLFIKNKAPFYSG